MSNTLRTVIERLRRDALAGPRHIFDAGRDRQPTLGGHRDVASVLAALADDAEATYPARDALTRALLAEHRASGEALWASVLLVAFFPMLSRLRHRLVSDTVPRDELDQLVVTSFLAAIAELPFHDQIDRLAMRLRQRTERQVFAYLRKERDQRHESAEVEELEQLDADALAPHRSTSDDKRYDLALLVQRATEEGVPQRGLEVVVATVLRRELLRSYVERMAPADDLERERLYQRLKRQRSRVLRRLRTMLTDASPPLVANGF